MNRETVRTWLQSVMTDKGWNASEWARQSGVNQSTISRALSVDGSFIPRMSTIIKMAEAASVSVPFIMPTSNLDVYKLDNGVRVLVGSIVAPSEWGGEFALQTQTGECLVCIGTDSIKDGDFVAVSDGDSIISGRFVGNKIFPEGRPQIEFDKENVIGIVVATMRQIPR